MPITHATRPHPLMYRLFDCILAIAGYITVAGISYNYLHAGIWASSCGILAGIIMMPVHNALFRPNLSGVAIPFGSYNLLQQAAGVVMFTMCVLSVLTLILVPLHTSYPVTNLTGVYVFLSFWGILAVIPVWFGMLALHGHFYRPAF